MRHGNFNQVLVINHDHIIHSAVLLLPPKQEVDITSVCQTGMFPCFAALVRRKIDAEMTLS